MPFTFKRSVRIALGFANEAKILSTEGELFVTFLLMLPESRSRIVGLFASNTFPNEFSLFPEVQELPYSRVLDTFYILQALHLSNTCAACLKLESLAGSHASTQLLLVTVTPIYTVNLIS